MTANIEGIEGVPFQLPVGVTEVRFYFMHDSGTDFARVVCAGGNVNLPAPWSSKVEPNKESWFRPPNHPSLSANVVLRLNETVSALSLPQQPPSWVNAWDFRGKDAVAATMGWNALPSTSFRFHIVTSVLRGGQSIQSKAILKFGFGFDDIDKPQNQSVFWYRKSPENFMTPFIDENGKPFDPAVNDTVVFQQTTVLVGANDPWHRRAQALTP